jgi:hypothetical protein
VLSGLLLLVIVGAWLAVLVPMALRSHDTSEAMSSVDRFNDAMRVLSRREQTGRGSTRSVVLPVSPAEPRPAVPVAVRRRRVLLALLSLSAVALALGLLASSLGYVLFGVFAALFVVYVVHLRRLALRRAELAIRGVAAPRAAAARASARPQRIAGVPDRMPARPLPLSASLPAPAARYEDPQPVAGTWDPVQFPVPTYVTAPVAPPRPTRVVDLTHPGRWSEGLMDDDAGLSILDEHDELDDILDGREPPRRASGDW